MKLYIQSSSDRCTRGKYAYYGEGLRMRNGIVYVAGNYRFSRLTDFSSKNFREGKAMSNITERSPRFFEMLQQPEFFEGVPLSTETFKRRFPQLENKDIYI